MLTDLRVEGLTRPLGVETPRPKLSWRMAGDRRGLRQSAYRITVASSAARLAGGGAPDLWDSGKVAGSQSLDVAYAGRELAPRTQVFWRVEAWDEAGASAGAAESSWEMGLIDPAEWTAGWLAAETAIDRADREAGFTWVWGAPARQPERRRFRFRVALPAAGEGALLLGGVDRIEGAWIDGRPQPVLQAARIDFAKPPLTEIPVSLGPGEHVIAAEVSYNPRAPRPAPAGGFGALLRLRFADGRVQRWTSREGWRTALEAGDGWQAAAQDDGAWGPVEPIAPQPNVPWPARPAVLMRRDFTVEERPVRARLYATALGAYEASLNGARIGDALLAPECTDFRARTPYRAHDVTAQIRPGANTLGFLVGDGWYASVLAPVSRYPFGPPPRRLSAQLELTYRDGRRQVVTTDGAWKLRNSAVLASEIYNGEDYDARLELPGWDSPRADLRAWEPALSAQPGPGRLTCDTTPPIKVIEVLKPASVREAAPGVWVFDFGQNLAGAAQLKVKAAAGTKVTLKFAEILRADGTVDQANLRAARSTDTYVCRGAAGGESYQPRFTFHGFRYVEVTGLPPGARPDLKAAVIHSDLPFTAGARFEEPLFQKMWLNALWGQRSNFIGIPTDCPQRDERLGWTGDAMVFWDAAAFNMDVDAFTRRFMGELRIAQQPDGGFPIFAPFASGGLPPGFGPTPGWADAGVVLPWTVWRRSGDTNIVSENWPAMRRYLDAIQAANPDLVWRNKRGFDFADWLAVDAKAPGDPTTPKDLVATALWAQDCRLMAEMAGALGRADEAAAFTERRERIAAAFRAAFVASDGTIGNGSQTSYILPLRFELLAPDQRAAAVARLAAAIRARGVMLTTGFIGTPYILDVLADGGEPELAMALLRRTEFPSWGYMIRKGATTMWERWNGDTGDVAMNSYNHYAFGAVSGFLMRRLVGLDAAQPGFRRVRVRPLVGPQSRQGGGELASPMGRIAVDWLLAPDGAFEMALAIPPNASAEVHLPGSDIQEGGRRLADLADVTVLRTAGEASVLEVGAGRYAFSSRVRV